MFNQNELYLFWSSFTVGGEYCDYICCFLVCNVLGLEEGKECIVVGTLYKHMKLKPSILDEYSKEVNFRVAYVVFMLKSWNL